MEQEEKQVITQTFYVCPICKTSYTKKQDAEKCFKQCKRLHFNYVKLTMSANLVTGEYTFHIQEDYDYFEQGQNEFNEFLKRIDISYVYDHVDFMAYCLTRSEILDTTKRIRQYFIGWCEEKVNYMKMMMEK